jgi:hypothetical protein
MMLSPPQLQNLSGSKRSWEHSVALLANGTNGSPSESDEQNLDSMAPEGAATGGRPFVQRWAGVVMVCLGAVTVLLNVFVWSGGPEAPPWSPLGPFPVQYITDEEPVDVFIGEVTVDGQKCRHGSSGNGVQVSGEYAWYSSPSGFVEGQQVIASVNKLDGCESTLFRNQIPGSVSLIVCEGGPTVWRIAGSETPIGDIGSDGVVVPRSGLTLGWQTENFELVCGPITGDKNDD